MTTPTRDEAVRDRIAGPHVAVPLKIVERIRAYRASQPYDPVLSQIEIDMNIALAPAPASGRVDAVGVCGISADTESKRVLKLHFKHEVTDADRKTIIDAFNTLNRERRSALSPAATPVSEAGGEAGYNRYLRDKIRSAVFRATSDELDGNANGDIIVKGCVAAGYDDPEDAARGFMDGIVAEVLTALLEHRS